MPRLKGRLALLALLGALLITTGCGSFEFKNVAELDEQIYRDEVEKAGASVFVFAHDGPDGAICQRVGAIVDRIAETPWGDLRIYHWDMRKRPQLHKVLGFKGAILGALYEKGKAVGYIRSFTDSDAVNRGLFFALLRKHLVPGQEFGGHGSAKALSAEDFEGTIREATRPVVLCFKNDGG